MGHGDGIAPYIKEWKDYGYNTAQSELGLSYALKLNNLPDWHAIRRSEGEVTRSEASASGGRYSALLTHSVKATEDNFVSLLQYVDTEPGKHMNSAAK